MDFLDNNILLKASIIVFILTFVIRMPRMCRPKCLNYEYLAQTRYASQDHTYKFRIQLMRDGFYRCYIEQAPVLFGKRLSRYAINFVDENRSCNQYIFSNRKIRNIEEAKELCAEWGDFNQYVIDSHRFSGK